MNKKLLSFLSLLLVLLSIPVTMLASPDGLQADDTEQTVFDVPYYEGFEDVDAVIKWTQMNNDTPYQWTRLDFWGYQDSPCAYLLQSGSNGKEPCNNRLVSPGIRLKKGMTYQLSFFFHATVSFDSDMSVYLLKNQKDTTSKEKILDVKSYQQDTYKGEITPEADGVYYLAFHDKTKWWENGTALRYAAYVDDVTVTPLSNNAVPSTVKNLRQVPAENGKLGMTLKWTNPSVSREGEPLDFLSSVTIYKDKKDSVVLRNDIAVGGEMSWNAPNPTEGKHTYTVVAGNTVGNGEATTVNTFIGTDMPGAPKNLTAVLNGDKTAIDLSWTQAEFGQNGGWYNKSGVTYRIVRKPDGKVLATNNESTSYSDTDLSAYGKYFYEVTARNADGVGATSVSPTVKAGKTAVLPLRQGWENADTYSVWTIVDNNKDGNTLAIDHIHGYNSASAIGMTSRDKKINESLYSPPVKLEKGKTYKFTAKVVSNRFQTFSLDVTYGKDSTVNAQRNVIHTLSNVGTDGEWSIIEKTFTPASTSTAFIGMRVYDMSSSYIWFDDIRIEELHENNIEATSITNSNTTPTVGETLTTGVTYTNVGSKRSGKFTVQLLDDDGNVLGEKNVSRPIAAGATATASISWTAKNVGGMSLRGRAIMEGDECAGDDYTDYVKLTVQPQNMHAVTVGTGKTLSSVLPFSRYGVAFNQTIYNASAFGNNAGVIDSMAYKVRFSMSRDYKGVPFKVYMGNTDQQDMNPGWIPANNMELVFDGKLDMMRGEYDFVIPFDKPFNYNGGNLTVMVIGEYDSDLFSADGYGIATYATDAGLGASRSGNVMDPENPNQSEGSFYSYVPNTIFFIDSKTYGSITGKVTDTEGNAIEGISVSMEKAPKLIAKTDESGVFTIPYAPSGWQRVAATGKGYVDRSASGNVESGKQTVIDIKNVEAAPLVNVTGKVVDVVDDKGIAGATVTIVGDSVYKVVTGADGSFSIDKVYSNKVFTYTVEANDYDKKTSQWMFYIEDGETTVDWGSLSLTPTTAAPYSVAALDANDKANVSWELPVQPVTLTKGGEYGGQFGGKFNMSVGHRYSADELKAKGVDGKLYLTHLRYVPMCAAKFTLKVWQGKEGFESEVYSEEMTVESYTQWNDWKLKKPFKIDPTKSTIIGYSVNCSNGAYPVSFDRGPLVEGGDCLFDDEQNAWSTAAAALPGQMDYNWCIEAVLGSDDNSREVAWAQSGNNNDEAKPVKAYAPEDMPAVVKTLSSGGYSAQLLDVKTSTASTVRKAAPAHNMPAGYNVYRLLCGEEADADKWTKVNETPVSGTSFVDDGWKGLENKPYRYAVRSVYSDDVMSVPTFSDGVDKGRYSKLTVSVSTKSGNAEGAEVKLMNDYYTFVKKADAAGNVTFDHVHFDKYLLQVLKPY